MMGKKYQQDDGEEELIKAFQVFDKDGKGSITSVELRFILTGLGDRISDEEAENIISQADPSGGGTINYTSFVRFIHKILSKKVFKKKLQELLQQQQCRKYFLPF